MSWNACARCGHPWEWHGPGKDCMCGGCMWFAPFARLTDLGT